MGQSQSSQPPPKAPTIVQYDPLPSSALVSGIGVGGKTQACQYCLNSSKKETCGPCKLFVAQGISASGVRMYREIGNVSRDECNRFSSDLKLVNDKKLAFAQFKSNLVDGKYFEDLNNGYCAQMSIKPGEESKIVDVATMTADRLVKPVIRKITPGGGYSSTTKLFLKPSIPFRISLNGTTVDVPIMTLFHPSPLRIENVQHDAVLTLNDTANPNAGLIVLVPIVGSLKPKEGGEFFSRIASYIQGVLQPNPATSQYEAVEVPTGNDWNLTKLFPGIPDEGTKQTVVNAGFFTWKGMPPLVEAELGVTKNTSPNADVLRMGWKPASNVVGPTFVMLQDPVEVNVFDLQMFRRLPVTPVEEAMPVPMLETVTYTPKAKCDSGGVLTGKKEKFENKCDPFAAMEPVSTITSDTIFSVVLGIMTAVAVFIGLYFALKYASDNNWGTKLQQWGRQAGKYLASAPPPGSSSDTSPPPPPPPPAAPSGGPRRTTPRQGEDFAFTNDAAIELRRRKKAEQEELARLKKEADAAAAKAKAEEAAEMERLRKEAEENAREAREQAAARAEMERKAAAEAESRLARPVGPGKAAPTRQGEDFAFTNPLAERQRQKRAEQAELARLKREADEAAAKAKAEEAAELARLKKQADEAAAKAKAETERRRAEAAGTGLFGPEDLRGNQGTVRILQPGDPGYEETRRRELEEQSGKKLKRRVIKSSDRDLTAEEKEQKKKDEDMVARALQPQKDFESRKPASTASSSSSSATPPPAEDAKKKADIDKKLKALETLLRENEERKKAAQTTIRRVVDARNKAKTLRRSPPKLPSQADREIDRVKEEADKAAKDAEAAAKEMEVQAQRQQRFAAQVQEQANKFKSGELSDRVKAAMKEAEQAEADATKTREEIEAEREKVTRDLAAARSRLRASQSVYNRATQRRNLTTGQGRTRRRR